MKRLFDFMALIFYFMIATVILIRAFQCDREREYGLCIISLFAAISMYICLISMFIEVLK